MGSLTRKKTLTVSTVREFLDYDPEAGVFLWKKPRPKVVVGAVAGHLKKDTGYRTITILGRMYFAHQVAWLYVHGTWPPDEVDHKDHQHDHNAIHNLRLATRSQNQANASLRVDNTSGFRGVTYYPRNKKWGAYLSHDKRRVWLGLHATPEEAHAAVVQAGKRLHGEFSSHAESKKAA